MQDRKLIDDLVVKLQEMEEQLSMATLEAPPESLLGTRIRHLKILALYVRSKLESVKTDADLIVTKRDGEKGVKPAG